MLLPHSSKSGKTPHGFTLVEMLTVTAIIAIVASLSAKALNVSHRGLPRDGSAVVDLISLAQQSALAKNRSTALVYASTGSGTQAFGLFELVLPNDGQTPTSQDWKQVGAWTQLGSGVAFEHDPQVSTFMDSPNITPALPPVSLSGTTVDPEGYQVFLPGSRLAGGVSNAPFPRLHLVEGILKNGDVQYTSRGGDTPPNYYDILINPATGRPIVERP